MTALLPEVPRVEAPFVDTRAADLTLRLGEGPLPHLGATRVDLGHGLSLELAVIGCSHQALLERRGAVVFSETFACPEEPRGEADWDGRLLSAEGPWGGHEFEATTLLPVDFEAEVASLLATAGDSEHHVVRGFAGAPGAVTAIAFDGTAQAPSWQTWHCYPQHGEIVHSRSRLIDMEGTR